MNAKLYILAETRRSTARELGAAINATAVCHWQLAEPRAQSLRKLEGAQRFRRHDCAAKDGGPRSRMTPYHACPKTQPRNPTGARTCGVRHLRDKAAMSRCVDHRDKKAAVAACGLRPRSAIASSIMTTAKTSNVAEFLRASIIAASKSKRPIREHFGCMTVPTAPWDS